jgi:hypothetical protein
MATHVTVRLDRGTRPAHVGGEPNVWHSLTSDAPSGLLRVAPGVEVVGDVVDLVAWATELLRLADECSDAADELAAKRAAVRS